MLVTNPVAPGSWAERQIENISKGWWVLLVSGVLSAVACGGIVVNDWSVADLAFVIGVVLVVMNLPRRLGQAIRTVDGTSARRLDRATA